MNDPVVPNLFHYATKELSQDAFICWLLDWANAAHAQNDAELHQAGRFFLNAILKKHDIPPVENPQLKVRPQWYRIDILVEINSRYILLIEDKTGTEQHGNQLKDYKERIAGHYPDHLCLPVFIKTGDQSDYRDVEKEGYKLFSRKDMLEVLRYGRDRRITNTIFLDFLHYLEQWDTRVESYRTSAVESWEDDAWIGFFKRLQGQKNDLHWGYVSNPKGGFVGAWWNWKNWEGCEVYLQIEQGALCFKIEVTEKTRRTDMRDPWHRLLMEAAQKDKTVSLIKPKFRSGRCMTVAKMDQNDWLAKRQDGSLDFDKTLSNLKRAEQLIFQALEM